MHTFLSKLKGKQFIALTLGLFILLTGSGVAFAYTKCSTYCFAVNNGSTATIDINQGFGDCRIVTNKSTVGGVLALPIKNPYEWFRFRIAAGDKDSSGTSYYTLVDNGLGGHFTNYLQTHGVTVAKCTTDVCTDITGIQTDIPENHYRKSDGTCPLVTTCTFPNFFNPGTGSCQAPDAEECINDGQGGIYLCYVNSPTCFHMTQHGNPRVNCPQNRF